MVQIEKASPSVEDAKRQIEQEILTKLNTLKDKFNPRLDLLPEDILRLCKRTSQVLLAEPSLLRLTSSELTVVVGDLHGQFKDLQRIFARFGQPPSVKYVFLGDYVDRGRKSIEVCLLLWAMKCSFPDHIYLLRGNHESATVNKEYGFYEECKRRLSILSSCTIFEGFTSVFNALPIAAILNGRIFCVHAGLSPHLQDLKQIDAFKRPAELPDGGLIHDILWSDPAEPDDELNADGWGHGRRRCAPVFGPSVVETFLRTNKLSLICRSHGYAPGGYKFFAEQGLLTIFTATNYASTGNVGAVLLVDNSDEARIHQLT